MFLLGYAVDPSVDEGGEKDHIVGNADKAEEAKGF